MKDQKIFSFNDVVSVRIICQGCGSVLEVPLERFESEYEQERCAFCRNLFVQENPQNPDRPLNYLKTLALTMKAIKAMKEKQAQIEFVLRGNFTSQGNGGTN